MEIINNVEWYFDDPKNAIYRYTGKKLTKSALNTVVFDGSVNENVKFCFPLNDDFSLTETRELPRPITVRQVLTLISDFYDESLKTEHIDKAFAGNEEWKEEILDRYDGDMSELKNFDVFEDTCAPDFCGIHLLEPPSENAGEYFVGVGPE